jgi:hypothetical protein
VPPLERIVNELTVIDTQLGVVEEYAVVTILEPRIVQLEVAVVHEYSIVWGVSDIAVIDTDSGGACINEGVR